jgi:hypothetical protein
VGQLCTALASLVQKTTTSTEYFLFLLLNGNLNSAESVTGISCDGDCAPCIMSPITLFAFRPGQSSLVDGRGDRDRARMPVEFQLAIFRDS